MTLGKLAKSISLLSVKQRPCFSIYRICELFLFILRKGIYVMVHSKIRNLVSVLTCGIVAIGTLCSCGFEVVDTGYRGIETNFGKVVGEPLPEGIHFYNPMTSDIVEFDVREQKAQVKMPCYTKDTQMVDVEVMVNYRPDPTKVHLIYKDIGRDFADKVFDAKLAASLKDTVGQYIADDLVAKRAAVALSVRSELAAEAAKRGVIVSDVNLVNLDFDDAYEKAAERQAVAVKDALTAKNQTVQVQEQANQRVISAQADAKAMQIKSEALSKNQNLVNYEMVLRWDGALPKIMGNNGSSIFNLPAELLKGK
jgi:regulator of protease activity HflC (stomatin/prohibitin superfamily)